MILEFGFRNFFSFREDVEISFRLDAKCPKDISQGHDFCRVLGIKGANGSGKTQVLKALSFLSEFCTKSFNSPVDSQIAISPFFDNKDPSFFFIDFRINMVEYRYELLCNTSSIVSETIYRTTKRRVKILERIGNSITHRVAAWKKLDEVKLRKNASIISTAHQYELQELGDIYQVFDFFETNVGFTGFDYAPRDMDFVSKFLAKPVNNDILSFIIEFIKSCDTGVSDIQIRSFEGKNGEKQFFPLFFHESDGMALPIPAHTESSGTKALFQMLTSYFLTRQVGGILIVDEFDINLHPDILPRLINLFDDTEKNPRNAQLIFATHDSEILETLGRYRTYLVAKRNNESFAYRLDEIPGDILRNDRPIRPLYVSGRIGGVPRDVTFDKE